MMNTVASVAVACPHCGAQDASGGQSQFCASCGKALPSALPTGPRVVSGSAFASTSAGQKLQADELNKTARKAHGALLAVAIIQTIVTGVLVMVANSFHNLDRFIRTPAFIALAVIAALFWGLWVWALRQPLPAAIAGLVVYGTLKVIDVIAALSSLSAGKAGRGGFGGIGIGWLDIIIIAVLCKAIGAGLQYRKMLQQGMA